MKRGGRWLAILLCLFVGAGGVALTRPTPPYAGRVLYLRLHLAPFFGSSKEIQYWIDADGGRVRYAEVMPNSATIRAFVNNRPVTPTAPQWMYIAMSRRADGTCGVSSTNWLSGDERGIHIRCAAVLALRDPGVVRASAGPLAGQSHEGQGNGGAGCRAGTDPWRRRGDSTHGRGRQHLAGQWSSLAGDAGARFAQRPAD